MTYSRDDLFERAKQVGDVLATAQRDSGIKLHRSGREWRGVCPFGGCGTKSSPCFVIQTDRQRWKCYVCEPRWGDVIELEHRLFSTGDDTLRDAARRIVGDAPVDPRACERRAQQRAAETARADASDAWKAELAARLWRERQAAAGSPVQAYLEGRGWYGPVLGRALGLIGFHPRAWHSGHPLFGAFLPAMILLITAPGPDGRPVATGGVHLTYLERYRPARGEALLERAHGLDAEGFGWRKIQRDGAKKMFGPTGLLDGERAVPGGVWLTPPDARGPLIVGEGFESTGSAAILMGGDIAMPMRALAALSLDRIQGLELRDDQNRVDVMDPKGDPERPPLTWPEPPHAPWGEVIVAVDRDMSRVKPMKVTGFVVSRVGKRRTVKFARDGEARTALCARLATEGWRRSLGEGSETTVRAIQPGPGRDFNDELMSRAEPAVGA